MTTYNDLRRLRIEDYERRNWRAVQDRIREEQPVRDAIRRADTLNRIRLSQELRNRCTLP